MTSKRSFQFATIADPIESFDPEAETTFFLLAEITRRKHASWVITLDNLFIEDAMVRAKAALTQVHWRGRFFSYEILDYQIISLNEMDVIFLRKDPPVNERYLNYLTLLELLEYQVKQQKTGPLFINSPSGIKLANEKIQPLFYPGISPSTLVTSSKEKLLEFLERHQKVIVKPLNACGGFGIFFLTHKDPNVGSILETATLDWQQYVMMQKYIPAAKKGDKRILLFNGKILGSFLRVPATNDFRGNMHRGATWHACEVTCYEQKTIHRLASKLCHLGLSFVGIDFIGSYITEINVTSPMGIREINQINQVNIERDILDFIILVKKKAVL